MGLEQTTYDFTCNYLLQVNMEDRPQLLQRVQHAGSFTQLAQEGLFAQGHYFMDRSHWLNKSKIQKHLDWNDKSLEPTPFISLFDSAGMFHFVS